MSQQQWGHGYYKGFNDGIREIGKTRIPHSFKDNGRYVSRGNDLVRLCDRWERPFEFEDWYVDKLLEVVNDIRNIPYLFEKGECIQVACCRVHHNNGVIYGEVNIIHRSPSVILDMLKNRGLEVDDDGHLCEFSQI